MTKTNQKTIAAPIKLTASAINAIKNIEKEQNIPDEYGLRVGVKGGGCSGFTYVLGFDEQKEKDDIYEVNGIKVFIDKTEFMYLMGMEVDWVEGLNNRGFSFNNPNAKSTCGCGTSFDV